MKRLDGRAFGVSRALRMVAVAGVCMLGTASASSQFQGHYFLTRVGVAAAVTQTLLRCPQEEGGLVVETSGLIVTKYGPDYTRSVTLALASNDFWIGRQAELNLRENGTLSSVNVSAEGAGGAVLGAFFKTISSLVPLAHGFNEQSSDGVSCTADTMTLLGRVRALSNQIDEMEASMAGKSGEEATRQRAEIERARTRLAALREPLTRSTQGAVRIPTRETAAAPTPWTLELAANDLSGWFDPIRRNPNVPVPWASLTRLHVVGANGFLMTVTPNQSFVTEVGEFNDTTAPDGTAVAYVLPVPASMTLCVANADHGCLEGQDDLATGATTVPQASLIHYARLRGGVFANRTLKATFAESGAPTQLSYQTRAQASNFNDALAGAIGAVQTIREQPTAERQRELARVRARIDLITAQNELETLLDAQTQSTGPTP